MTPLQLHASIKYALKYKVDSLKIFKSHQPNQLGLSLVELMVAMVIGLFLILGVTQIFIANQKTYLFQQSQVGNQENSRFTLTVVEQELSKAGYRSLPTTSMTSAFPADSSLSGCSFSTGNAIAVISNGFCVRYQTRNATDVDCQGNKVTTAFTNNYTADHPIVIEKIQYDATTLSLNCTSNLSSGASPTQALTSGIAAVHFEFGYSTSADPTAKTVNAFSTTAPSGVIGAVRYAALITSTTTAALNVSSTNPILADWVTRYGPAATTDDTKIYQIAQSTVMLRNLMP